jgi:hypothetical protein
MTVDNRRKESRIRSKGRVNVLAEGVPHITGTIYDVSVWGIGVETDSGINTGTPVHLDGEGFAAEGIVRYCGRHGHGYRLGVELKPATTA